MLVLSGVLLLLLAGSALAADESAPDVDVPEDIPGADVLVEKDDTYQFDSSASTDDVGIVQFMWEFNDGMNDVVLTSVDGKQSYTFLYYTQTWVTVHAWDAAGNEGFGFFCIDVVETVPGDLVLRDTSYTVDHSLRVNNGDVVIDNSRVSFMDGAGKAGGVGAGVPDQLGESLTPDGDLAGHWEPYYYYSYWSGGNSYYGIPYLDDTTKMSGDYSIRISSASYYYGFEYHFDTPQDLTKYNMLNYWFHSDYYSYPYYVTIYFYRNYGSYSSPYMYFYNYYQGYYSSYYGWYGMSQALDPNNYDYWGSSGMSDLSQVDHIRFYMYAYRYPSGLWMDHVGFSYHEEWNDPIMDDTNPDGDFPGRWSSSYSSPSLSTHHVAGDYSIYFYFPSRNYYSITYSFDDPTDFSAYDGMRLFTYWTGYYYLYWYSYQFYVRFANGGYAYYYLYGTAYLNYYVSYYYGRWDTISVPWGPHSGPISSYNVDWTQVSYFSFQNIYTSSYSGSLYLDGLDFLSTGGAGGPKPPSDTVPLAIYNTGGDTTIQNNAVVSGAGKTGARIATMDGSARFQNAIFDNVWTSETASAGNGLNIYGGIEVYGDAVIDHVTFVNCQGPGLALFDGAYQLDPDTIDLAGTAQKMKMAPKLIMGCTEKTTGAYSLDVSGWALENSPGGTGILFMAIDTTGNIDVSVHGNMMDGNNFAGLVISNHGGGMFSPFAQGTTANLDVTIYDQLIEDSGSYGIVYYAGGGYYDANIWATLTLDNVTVRNSGEGGMGVMLDNGATNLAVSITDCLFERNSGFGTGFDWEGFFGECDVTIENSTFRSNSDAGLYLYTNMGPYVDGDGNVISPVAYIDLAINSSFFEANSGWGIVEDFNGWDDPDGGMAPPWSWNGPTRTTLVYNLTMTYSEIIENQAGGFMSQPSDGWMHGNWDANRDISGITISDNRGPALYIAPNHDLWGGDASVSDIFMVSDSRINDNSMGVMNYLGYNNFGYYGEVHLYDCRIEDNDAESIAVYGSWSTDGVYYWGNSRVLGMIYYVDGCRINTPMMWELLGADDSGHPSWDAIMGLQFTNNIVDIEEEVTAFYIGAYTWCDDFTAYADIGNNRWYRGYVESALHMEMYGGYNLNMDVRVFDWKIDNPGGAGLEFIAGTTAMTTEPHQVFGKVMLDNVSISNAFSNGINFTIENRENIGFSSRAVLEAHDMVMNGVGMGIVANDLTGRIYDTYLSNLRGPAVNLQYSTFDFYSCDVGPVSTENIKVLTKGAARLWYDVGVDVKWAGGTRVMGAVVSVQDNTWSTIAVNTVSEDDVLPIGYVNSYTVLPDSVYSKSPFLVTGTYLGLKTERLVDIDANMVVDLILVDDVMPRLTINLPADGSRQRETFIMVKGYAWDQHSGLDSVMVSLNGIDWFEAEGVNEFEYTFANVDEGNIMVMVKAIDFAGNERAATISVLVDATPPPIIIIEPVNDVILTKDPTLDVIGVTEMGATVTVDNVQMELEHTLFSTTLTLKEGAQEIRVVAIDRLGNRAEHVIEVTLDTIAPTLIVTSPEADSVLGTRRVTVMGQTEAGATVQVNGVTAANQMGVFRQTLTLSEGPNTIVVTSVDAVGNKATVSMPVRIDTTEPWLELSSPMDGDVFGSDGILVVGWVEAGSIVTVNDQAVAVTDSHFTATITGREGKNLLEVTVADLAGNELTRTVEVWYDTTAPGIDLTAPMDGLMTAEDTVEVTGVLTWNDVRESFRDITLTINGEFAPFAADGKFRVQYDLVEGTNPLFIRATDDVGNFVVETVTVVKDSKAPFLLVRPTPTFDHEVWNKPSTYNSMVYIEGDTEPGAVVTVNDAGVEVDEDGHFNVSILLGSIPGDEELLQVSVKVVSTDAAGNFKEEIVEVYRLKQEETDPGIGGYDAAQYWVLLLSIIILVVAIVAAAFMWRRIGASEDEDLYLEEV